MVTTVSVKELGLTGLGTVWIAQLGLRLVLGLGLVGSVGLVR